MRPGRRSFMLGAGLAAASMYIPWVRAQTDRSLIDPERERIKEAMAHEDIPGAAVCLVHGGEPAWIEGFGVTDRASKRPIEPDTIFSIQSTSKHFTATAIMLAVQRGILDLDEPITSYLPDFTVQSRFEAAPQKKMTLRLLLGNRAGFTHEAPVGNNYDPAFPSFEAHVRSISQTWLRFPVGERYRYSNLGFDLAGYILQLRSGMPFAHWLTQMLFEPLGMKDSTKYVGNYVARDSATDLTIKENTLGMQQGTTFTPIHFTSPDALYIAAPDGGAVTYRCFPASSLQPAHLECSVGEQSLDYNEGPQDIAGPDEPAWDRYVGTWRLHRWGKPADEVTVHRKNGYLYLNHLRLIAEPEPGLFFTSDGEAVDFRQREPTWKSLRLRN